MSHTINIRPAYFLQDGGLNHKQFWRYIKSTRKDQSGVTALSLDGTHIYNAKDKAEALDSQFSLVKTSQKCLIVPAILILVCQKYPSPWMELNHC